MALDIGPFGKKDKDKDSKEDRKKRRKKAREQAVKGYKRKGGMWERIKKGFDVAKELPEKSKPKR